MITIRSALLASVVVPLLSGGSFAANIVPIADPAAREMLINATEKPEIYAAVMDVLRVYETQFSQAFCGIASLEITFNSLGVPGHDSVDDWYPYLMMNQDTVMSQDVSSIKPKNIINVEGLTLDQLGEAASANKYITAMVYHATPEKLPDDQVGLGPDEFKKVLLAALANPKSRVIMNYLRGGLNQVGAGHFSPVAAYDPKSDRVLVMDTARYKSGPKYDKKTRKPVTDPTTGEIVQGLGDGSGQPVWVTRDDVWAAVNTIDKDAGTYRGIVVLTRRPPSEIKG